MAAIPDDCTLASGTPYHLIVNRMNARRNMECRPPRSGGLVCTRPWKNPGIMATHRGTRTPLKRCFGARGVTVVIGAMVYSFFAGPCSIHMMLTARMPSCRVGKTIRASSALGFQLEILRARRRCDIEHEVPGLSLGPIRGCVVEVLIMGHLG